MNLQELIIQSLELLLIGMGTVFIILIMLIFLINFVSGLLPEEKVEETVHTARAANMATASTNNKDLIAVISAAVATYRKRHTSQ